MSYTPVQNRFWSDGWVRQLNALDRYLFLYLLTNGRGGRTGIYELPLDLMASESGVDEKDLRLSMLQRLEPKIYYKEGWVIVVNYLTHQLGGGSKYEAGVRTAFGELPKKIQEIAKDCGYPIDTLSIGYPQFPNRIEQNIKKDFAKAKSSLQSSDVRIEEDVDTKQKKPRDTRALRLREAFYDLIEQEYGSRPTVNMGDYIQLQKALKKLEDEKHLKLMMEDAIASGKGQTVRSVFTDRQIDVYAQENL